MIFLVWVGIIFSTATTWGQDSAKIHQANQLYNQNKFSEAAEIYERAIANGVKNGHLHYNLGNAYFRTGNLPQAILHYTKAQNLLPRNEDVEANLKYALRQTVDKLEVPIPSSTVLFWTRDFNLNEYWTGLLWANLFFWVSMAVGLQYPTPATRLARKILLAFLLLVMISTGFRWHQENRHIKTCRQFREATVRTDQHAIQVATRVAVSLVHVRARAPRENTGRDLPQILRI